MQIIATSEVDLDDIQPLLGVVDPPAAAPITLEYGHPACGHTETVTLPSADPAEIERANLAFHARHFPCSN